MLDPALTRELLTIELKTLGVSVTPSMRWNIRCHENRATLQLRDKPAEAGVSVHAPRVAPEQTASSDVDLSATDEAAWPRLIAISASELVVQIRSATAEVLKNAPSTAQASVRLQPVAFAVKTQTKESYLAAVGIGIAREGNPGTNLLGADLELDRRFGGAALLSFNARGEWGTSNLGDVNVKWRSLSAALGVGATLNLRVVELDALAGFRWGWLVLKGEPTTESLSGRTLAGNTGGPLIAGRFRRSIGERLFFGLALELGACAFPVRGTTDGVTEPVTVDGRWTSATLSVGHKF